MSASISSLPEPVRGFPKDSWRQREHSVFLTDADFVTYRMTRLTACSPPRDGNKHTSTGHALPDFYLQNTCKFALKSVIARRPVTRRPPCSPRAYFSTTSGGLRNIECSRRQPHGTEMLHGE
jgi:hypothetical protein